METTFVSHPGSTGALSFPPISSTSVQRIRDSHDTFMSMVAACHEQRAPLGDVLAAFRNLEAVAMPVLGERLARRPISAVDVDGPHTAARVTKTAIVSLLSSLPDGCGQRAGAVVRTVWPGFKGA